MPAAGGSVAAEDFIVVRNVLTREVKEGLGEAVLENFVLLVIKELKDFDETSDEDPLILELNGDFEVDETRKEDPLVLELNRAFEVETEKLLAGYVVDARRDELE